MNILEVQDLCKTYGEGEAAVQALRHATFSVRKGEFIAIIGESGSGKSTLLNVVGALDKATSGKVWIDGQDIFSMPEKKLTVFRRQHIGFIFQSFNLIPELNVEQNITFPLLLDYKRPDQRFVNELLNVLGLTERRHHLPSQLSGGQQQRVAIGRALVTRPALILADEPTGNLDSKNSQEVLALLQTMSAKYQQTILMITHNMGVVAEICDYVYVMYAGKIMEQAETFELFDHTMHPYTKGLLDSIPRIGQNAERLHTIPGVVPNLLHLSQGCPFSNRCEYATDQCRTEKAQLHPVAPDHQVRCFRCEEEHQ